MVPSFLISGFLSPSAFTLSVLAFPSKNSSQASIMVSEIALDLRSSSGGLPQ